MLTILIFTFHKRSFQKQRKPKSWLNSRCVRSGSFSRYIWNPFIIIRQNTDLLAGIQYLFRSESSLFQNSQHSFSHLRIHFCVHRSDPVEYFNQVILQQIFCRFHRFCCGCIFMETLHPFSSYDFIFRYLNMTLGIFALPCTGRDKTAFDVFTIRIHSASAFQSLFLIFGTEPLLRSLSAEGFIDASRARIQAFETFFLRGNLNDISYFSSIGAVIGLIWMYFEKVKWKRYVLLFLTVPSVLGVFSLHHAQVWLSFVSILIFCLQIKINLKSWVLPSLVLIIFYSLLFRM